MIPDDQHPNQPAALPEALSSNKKKSMIQYVAFAKDNHGHWIWRFKSADGQLMAESARCFDTKGDAAIHFSSTAMQFADFIRTASDAFIESLSAENGAPN